MEHLDPPPEQPVRDLLSGLIQQEKELGSLGTTLVLLLLCAGVEPAQKTPQECCFHPPSLEIQ